jgi:hypothetical protein
MLPLPHPQINPRAHPATPKTAKHQLRQNALDPGFHGVQTDPAVVDLTALAGVIG